MKKKGYHASECSNGESFDNLREFQQSTKLGDKRKQEEQSRSLVKAW
jgi:hypothetical protein